MTKLAIRPMTADDVDAAVALALAQGWRNRIRFYDLVLHVPTAQPLVGEAGGRVVATGLATANGTVGWLGAIVVDAAFRSRGFGRAMTEELIRRLRAAGCETISLEATDAGRPMYERMGFRLATSYHQLQSDHLDEAPAPPDGARVRRLEAANLAGVFELDRQATGEDRHDVLAVLAGPGWGGWVLERGRSLAGFLLPADRAYGAIAAPRFDDGLFLLDLHRSVVPAGGHVRAGVPHQHEAGWRELMARGWHETWRAPRMLLGPDVDWRPDWIWGQINSAMG
jgi:ribosomal protein S18 acetylase RimI-like enzyme